MEEERVLSENKKDVVGMGEDRIRLLKMLSLRTKTGELVITGGRDGEKRKVAGSSKARLPSPRK